MVCKMNELKNNKIFRIFFVLSIIAGIILIVYLIFLLNKNAKKKGYLEVVKDIVEVAQKSYMSNNERLSYIVEKGKIYSAGVSLLEIDGIKESNITGTITFNSQDIYNIAICNNDWCAIKNYDEEDINIIKYNEYIKSKTHAYITMSAKEVTTVGKYTMTILNKSTSEIDGEKSKYLINRYNSPLGVNSQDWENGIILNNYYKTATVNATEPGVFYVHVLTVDKNGNKGETISQFVHVLIDDAQRTTELKEYVSTLVGNPIITPSIKTDFVQPYLYEGQALSKITKDFKILKRAGYERIVIQGVVDASGGISDKDPIKMKQVWYQSSLNTYKTGETSVYDKVVDNLVKAAEDVGLKVYFGNVFTNDWWDGSKVTNNTWIKNNANFINEIIGELYSKYKSSSAFAGWYWTNEMYTNNLGYEKHWSKMLNMTIDYINKLDKNYPIIAGAYVSSYIIAEPEDVEKTWTQFMKDTKFRDGDIFVFQDGLGSAEFSVSKVAEYIKSIKKAVDSNPNADIQLGLIMENFGKNKTGIAPFSRFKEQLTIASYFAEQFFSFSYLHHYMPSNKDAQGNSIGPSYDKEYREFIGLDTSNDEAIVTIETPKGGSVYVDSNYDEAPVPAGFTVSSRANENIIRDGLVIKDKSGNEFVWVPVNAGIKSRGFQYSPEDFSQVAYVRYLDNGLDLRDVDSDELPLGVSEETSQINKYGGFYIARYESTFDYNNGDVRVRIQPTGDAKAVTEFYWSFSDSNSYTGYMWNNINYSGAKTKAEEMAIKYNYDSTIKTGLVNGKQWDTALRWIGNADETYKMLWDSRTWGNYNDSIGKAATGNYSSGVMRGTGSNEAWKAKNIYDLAGNLREWVSETNGNGQYTLRSNGYDDNGLYGTASYGILTDVYTWSNVGFRVVLYIQ